MMTQEQVNERIDKLQIEINILKNVIDYNKDFDEKDISNLSKEDKVKFIKAYQNLSTPEIINLYNKKFKTNYYPKSGGYIYRLIKEVRNETTPIIDLRHTKNNDNIPNTQEKVDKMKELVKQGLNNSQIAKQLKVSDMTIFNWKKKLLNSKTLRISHSTKYKYIDREELLKDLKIYYFGTDEEKDSLLTKFKLHSKDAIGHKMKTNIKKFNISPNEVGITKYPANVQEYKNIEYLKT